MLKLECRHICDYCHHQSPASENRIKLWRGWRRIYWEEEFHEFCCNKHKECWLNERTKFV